MATYYSQGSGNWSDLENWNTAANGSGTSPANIAAMDDQSFVIQQGHVITFDVEDALACDGSVSGWTTGLAGITITGASAGAAPGELRLTSASNTGANRLYGLRLKANAQIVGTNASVYGKLTAGSETSPVPSTATHMLWSLGMHSTVTIDLTYLALAMYGTGPIEPVYRLKCNASVGDTVLSCEGLRQRTNPNEEIEWRPGWTVSVANVNRGRQCELYELAAEPVGDGVLRLATPLTNAKLSDSLICLTRRNITVRGSGDTGYLFRYGKGAIWNSVAIMGSTIGTSGQALVDAHAAGLLEGTAVVSNSYYGIRGGSSVHVTHNAVVTHCDIPIYNVNGLVVDDQVVICGGLYGVFSGQDTALRGNTLIAGCTNAYHATKVSVVEENARLMGNTTAFCYNNDLIVRGRVMVTKGAYGIRSAIYSSRNVLVTAQVNITDVQVIVELLHKESSAFMYAVEPSVYTNLMTPFLRNDVTPSYAMPRVEMWPAGYAPAGTGTVTRRYPAPWVV